MWWNPDPAVNNIRLNHWVQSSWGYTRCPKQHQLTSGLPLCRWLQSKFTQLTMDYTNLNFDQLIFQHMNCGQFMAKLWLTHISVQASRATEERARCSNLTLGAQSCGNTGILYHGSPRKAGTGEVFTPLPQPSSSFLAAWAVISHWQKHRLKQNSCPQPLCSREKEAAREAWWVSYVTKSQRFLPLPLSTTILCLGLCLQALSSPKYTPCVLISDLLSFPLVWCCGFLQ